MYASGSSQAHESLGVSRSASVENLPTPESGRAVEVIEMANGETIWCVFVRAAVIPQGN